MFLCLICDEILEVRGYCLCGRLNIDHKDRVQGEYFERMKSETKKPEMKAGEFEKSRVDECPHCQWKGLVVPRIGLGCPNHGIWWYKPASQKTSVEDTCEEATGNDPWGDLREPKCPGDKKTGRRDKERGPLLKGPRQRFKR